MIAADASPLIWLSRLGHFELLQAVYGSVAITPEVYAETVTRATGYPNAMDVQTGINAGWILIIAPVALSQVFTLQMELHAGEAETLVMAAEHQTAAIVDDRKARNAARTLGVPTIGTAGVLLLARQCGHLSDLRTPLDQMRADGFRLSEQIYQRILAEAQGPTEQE